MAAPSYNYTLTNGSTADASQVQDNFQSILNGVTDGTKDLSISALTCAGTVTMNGNVNIGNASGDDLTITASLASTLPIKTTNSYDIGSATLGLRALYFGANSQTVNIKGSGSMSATWTLTLPVSAGTANYILITDGTGATSWSAITNASWYATSTTAGTLSTAAQSIVGTKSFSNGSGADVTCIQQDAGTTTGTVRQKWRNSDATRTFEIDADFTGSAEKLTVQSDTTSILEMARAGTVTLGVGLKLPTSGGTAATLSAYETGSWTANLKGSSSGTTYRTTDTVKFVRNGNLVTLQVDQGATFTATSLEGGFYFDGLPARLTPTTSKRITAIVTSSGTAELGYCDILTTNRIEFARLSGSFANGGSHAVSLGRFSLSYLID